MKLRIFILLAVCFLAACTSDTEENFTPTPDFSATDTANQIATAIAAKATEVAIAALYTPTPTPGIASLQDVILTSAEANELANRWSNSPADDTVNVSPEYCTVECISWIWEGGTNGGSTLQITLIRADSRDEASTLFSTLKAIAVTDTTPAVLLPELVNLPADTFAINVGSEEVPAFKVTSRNTSFVVEIEISMPDLSEDENLLFLGLYADRQIQKLIEAEK